MVSVSGELAWDALIMASEAEAEAEAKGLGVHAAD